MLSDVPWAVLEPLVEVCRPKAKTPPQDLRRTLSAILWRHQNGAKWRAVPAELGPWWRAAQVFIRWARVGVWERLLSLVQESGCSSGWYSSTAPACAPTRKRPVRLEGGISS
jgi:transposase